VLFTDMVGSTALRTRLGEGAADELRRRHDAVMDGVVAAKRGRLVKSTGDGIMATFESAADAVEAGVDAQQAIVVLSRELGVDELAIRIGVSAGDVSWSEHDCSGLPVVEAARLEQAAEAGQVLCSEIVRMLARGRAQVGFERVGELTLKGLEDPLMAYEVPWTVADVDSAGSADGRGPFAGRSEALAELAHVLEAARDGAGGCVLVAGEPGVGKTRLVSEALAKRSGVLSMAWGHSYASEAIVLGPVVELVDELLSDDPDRLRAAAAHHGPVLGELSEGVRSAWPEVEAPDRLDLADQRQRLHSAISDTMAAWAAVEPMVVVFDDLHWADELSVSMFRALARRAKTSPLVVIGTYRQTDLDRLHPLGDALPVLVRETSPTQIDLGGLDEDEVATFVSALAGTEIDPAVAAEIAAVTAGNPLFVGEIARHLAETGVVVRDADGAWRPAEGMPVDIPRGVRQVIGGRIGRLDEETQAFLAVASGFGGPFPLTTAALVAELSESVALDHVDAAVAAGLVEASGEFDVFDFTHALVRQTLYDEAGPSRQVRLHRRIAEALEAQLVGEPTGSWAASVARHYHRSAAMPGSQSGVRWAEIAAGAALDDAAFSDATKLVDIAAELADDGALSPELLVIRAEATAALGDAEASAEACSDAATALSDIETASLHARCVLNLVDAGGLVPVWDLATTGLGFCGDRRDDDWLVLRNYQLDGEEIRSPDYRGIPLETAERRELLDVSVRTGSSIRLSILFPNRAAILAHPNPPAYNLVTLSGDYRTAVERYEVILAESIKHGLAGQELEARGYLLRALDALGHHEQALDVLQGGADVFQRFPMSLQGGRYLASILMFGAGRGHTAETPFPVSHPDFPSTLTAGDWAHLMLAATAQTGDRPGGERGTFLVPRAVAHGGLAVVAAELGDPTRALSMLEEVLPACLEAPAGADEAAGLPSAFVRSLELTGEIRWVDEIRHMAGKIVAADFHHPLNCAREALGQLEARLGNRTVALDWFDRSRQARVAQGATPRVALVDLHEAEAELLIGGPRDKIRQLVTDARPALERGGYVDWLADCDRVEAAVS